MHLPGRTSQVRRVIWGRAVAGRRGLSRPGAGPAGRGRCSDPRAPASLLVSARSGGGLRRRDPPNPVAPPGLAGGGAAGSPAEVRGGSGGASSPTTHLPLRPLGAVLQKLHQNARGRRGAYFLFLFF